MPDDLERCMFFMLHFLMFLVMLLKKIDFPAYLRTCVPAYLRTCVPACLVGLLFLLASCSSEEITTKAIPTEIHQSGRQHLLPLANDAYLTPDLPDDTLLTAIAKITAVMQQQPEFRSFITEQLVARQTSEQTVLYISNRDQEIKAGLTLSAAMAQTALDLGYQFESGFFATGLSMRMPRLSFTVYLSDDELAIENWDYAAPVPVVAETEQFSTGEGYYASAYLPESTQPIHNEDDPDFDAMVIENNRSFFLLSAEPSEAEVEDVFWRNWQVVPCEQLLEQIRQETPADGTSSLIYQDQSVTLLESHRLVEPYNQCFVANIADRNEPVGRSNTRESRNGREQINEVRVHDPHLKQFCKWWKSYCNVSTSSHIASVASSGGNAVVGSLTWMISDQRKHFKNEQWVSVFHPTFVWMYQEGTHGDPYSQSFIGKHHNAGNTTTFTFNFGPTVKVKDPNTGLELSYSVVNAGISRTATTTDYDLYQQLIYYDDIIPHYYSTGSNFFDFRITKLW